MSMKKGKVLAGWLAGLCVAATGARGELQVSPTADNTLQVSFWAGRLSVVTAQVMRLGQTTAMPAVVLDNAQPDRTRFGQPALPFFTCPVLLPPGMTVQAARVARRARVERVPLTGPLAFNNQPYTGYDMTDPAQARAWALANHEDARLYATDAVYPAAPATWREWEFRGYRIADLAFTPFRYNPARGELELDRELTLELDLADGAALTPFARDHAADRELVARLVANPEQLAAYYALAPRRRRGGGATNYYVIITSTNLAAAFEPLRAFHSTDAEHQAGIITLDQIYAVYTNTAEADCQRIRQFIMEQLYPNGAEYILLGGDTEVVTNYWYSSDFAYAQGQIPVGRLPAENTWEADQCVAKATNIFRAGSDRVQLIPRADEVGPTLLGYTNIFHPYLPLDVDGTLYNAPPARLFPALDAHTLVWARGHGYYLYPQWASGWYSPNNASNQPIGVNFGCSGCVLDPFNDHPCKVYTRAQYGHTAYMGTVEDVTYNGFDADFFRSYLVCGTAGPAIGDMALYAWLRNSSLYTLLGDPLFPAFSESFQARMRVALPGGGSVFSRSYNIDQGTGVIADITFDINSFNACPWVITNIDCDTSLSNHIAFSCLASNVSLTVHLGFLDVTNIAAGQYWIRWEVRDATNDFHISDLAAQLTVTDKNILTDEDFIHNGNTNILPAGAYVLAADLVVGSGKKLVLLPGVELMNDWEFGGSWQLIVAQGGCLEALGAVTSAVRFSSTAGSPVALQIHRTDLIPLAADFRHCQFSAPILASNAPCANFRNCTFILPSGMNALFPGHITGTMKNCVITSAGMGAVGPPGDLSGFDMSYCSIAVCLTNSFSSPRQPQYHKQGREITWANDAFQFNFQSGLGSTCINAGDPDDPPDPDGTRADIGAGYHDLAGAIRVPGDQPTIQQGLAAALAATTAVVVAPGVYHENLLIPPQDWGMAARLIAASPTNRPVLWTTNSGTLLSCESSVFMDGFILRHVGESGNGAAVWVTNDNISVGFRNCEFSGNRDNAAVFGLANTSGWAGVGLYMWDCDFVSNTGNSAVFRIDPGLSNPNMARDTWNWMKHCRFAQNQGEAIFQFSAPDRYFLARDLEFRENTADRLINHQSEDTAESALLEWENVLALNNAGDWRVGNTAHLLLENCTAAANSSNITADGNATLRLNSSIIWNNAMTFEQNAAATVSVVYSDCDLPLPNAGEGNLNTNPLPVSAAAGDWRLLSVSPCIDSGDPALDYANEPAPNGSRINMGHLGNTPAADAWLQWARMEIVSTAHCAGLCFATASGQWYRTEFATSLLGAWTNAGAVCATSDTVRLDWPITTDTGYFRTRNFHP